MTRKIDLIYNTTYICPWDCAICCVDVINVSKKADKIIINYDGLRELEEIPFDKKQGNIYTQVSKLLVKRGKELSLDGKKRVVDYLASISHLCYLVPSALASTTTTIVSKTLGEEYPVKARHFESNAIILSSFISCCIALFIYMNKYNIIRIYTNDPEVVLVAISVIKCVAFYHFFDAVITIINGILRAYDKSKIPSILMGTILWGIGFTSGMILAFKFDMGVVGFWLGLDIASMTLAITLLIYYFIINYRSNQLDYKRN